MVDVTFGKFGQASSHMPRLCGPPPEEERLSAALDKNSSDHDVRTQLLARLPGLRAFARSLCHNLDNAEDLLQDTVLKACLSIHQFQPGTNLGGWLFTIMRNHFYSQCRRLKYEVEDVDGRYSMRQAVAPAQDSHLDKDSVCIALSKLRPLEREALLLVAIHGLTYDETAQALACPIGTIKSRVARARIRVAKLMSLNPHLDLEADGVTKAILESAKFGRACNV